MDEKMEKLTKRFEIAVRNFAHSCFNMKANESCFQAWFAAFVFQEFGFARVYREIHLDKKFLSCELVEEEKRLFPKDFFEKCELFPDVSISYEPEIDVRHTLTRNKSSDKKDIKEFLQQFAIISEFKVTGSTSKRTGISAIKRDLQKLLLFSMVHSKKESSNSLATYSIILDNNEHSNVINSEGFINDINKSFESIKNSLYPMKIMYFGKNLTSIIQVTDDFKIICI